MKTLIAAIFLLVFSNTTYSQEIVFSELPGAPVIINPANTGYFDGNWRFFNNYRVRTGNFNAPSYSGVVGFDKQFEIYNQQINGGFFYHSDISSLNTLYVHQFCFTTSYHLRISSTSIISFGIHAGLINKRTDNRNLTAPEQYDISIGQFNTGLPSGEIFTIEKKWYPDLGSGLSWRKKIKRGLLDAGIAAYHLNKPQEKFLFTESVISQKYIVHGAFEVNVNTNTIVKPRFFYSINDAASELNAGGSITYKLNYYTHINAGIFYRSGFKRNSDALIFYAGMKFNNWTLGLNYDYDISGLHNITTRSNAFEISLIYIRPSTKLDNLKEPCILY